MIEHPCGIERGSIEEPAFLLLRHMVESHDYPEHRHQMQQAALLHSIAVSLMRIAEHQEDIARNTG